MRATMLCRGKNNWKNKRQLTFQWTHPKGEDIFRQTTEVIYTDNYVEEHLCRRMVKGVHAIVLRAPARLTRKIIEAADILGVISGAGVGVDNIDVQVATERGILALHDALIQALKEGKLAGAALDVFHPEPPFPLELIQRASDLYAPYWRHYLGSGNQDGHDGYRKHLKVFQRQPVETISNPEVFRRL